MRSDTKELAAVEYNAAALKTLSFSFPSHTLCFCMHWHDRMELLRIRSGMMQVEHGTDTFCVSAGEVVILPPKTIHKGYTAEQAVEYDVLMFDVRSFYNETDICRTALPALLDGTIKLMPVTADLQTLQRIDSVYIHREEKSFALIAHIYSLLDVLFANCLVSHEQHPQDAMIQNCITYMEDHFAEDLSVGVISRHFGYTAAHFSRKFKRATGLTPIAYITIFRLETARKMLKNSTANISEIADLCGFSDANYFTRCFKKHFGVPPRYYRK